MPEIKEIKPKEKIVSFLTWKESKKIKKAQKIFVISLFFISIFFLFFQKNILGALLIILFLLANLQFKKQKEKFFKITSKGIIINKEIFLWKDIESFWIFEEPIFEISFKLKKGIPSFLFLPYPKEKKEYIEKILLQYLPQKEHHLSFFDVIAKKLGF